jgi:peptidoglycan-N-acetylglucosamine deacetylase
VFLSLTVAAHLALLLLLVGNATLDGVVLAGYLVYHGMVGWAVVHPRSRLFGPNRSRLDTRERVVALTFDDGPHPQITEQVLAILRAREARATFFLIGKWVERYPEVVRRIVADGHTIGNHTYAHSYHLWAFGPQHIADEVRHAQRSIASISGRTCRLFRAPVGLKSCFLNPVLKRQDLELVSWGLRVPSKTDRDSLLRRLRRRVVPGSIVLLHDGHDRKPEGHPQIVETLPVVLDELDAMGYRCVPIG